MVNTLPVFFFTKLGKLEPLLAKFTIEEEKQMKRMLQRMDILAKVLHKYRSLPYGPGNCSAENNCNHKHRNNLKILFMLKVSVSLILLAFVT